MSKKKTVIITGANRGIGKETAKGIAKLQYRIILACRNLEEAEKTKAEIIESGANEDIHVLKLDLASSRSISDFVSEFSRQFGKVNILINNAGVSTDRKSFTDDGFEINIGTNYIGTYLLTMKMLPYFGGGTDNRIINLTSDIYKIGWFRIQRINKYQWFRAYAVSKFMILLFTAWLSEELRDRKITVNAIHPGIVRTSIMYTGRWYDAIIRLMLKPFFIDVETGAKTSIYLATTGDTVNGKYFVKGRPREIRMTGRRLKKTEELMGYSKRIIQKIG